MRTPGNKKEDPEPADERDIQMDSPSIGAVTKKLPLRTRSV
jgi:hypothetical protein